MMDGKRYFTDKKWSSLRRGIQNGENETKQRNIKVELKDSSVSSI